MLAVASAHHHQAPSSTMAAGAAASSSSSSGVGNGTASHAAGSLAIDAAAASTSAQHSVSPALVSSPVGGVQQHRLPKALHIRDEFYGPFTITEPVLIDLLLSEPVDRLRRTLQHGITALIGLTPSPPVTRYAHSVGAMLLVRSAGGSVEAQAAALLHDIAHTALSHVVDGVFGYVVHEDDKMEYLDTTPIPDILSRHGLDPEEVLEESNYPLLELDPPAVCADRLDYGIRDSVSFGFLSPEEATGIQRDLRVSRDGTFCFASVACAKRLSEAYIQSDAYAWSNEVHGVLYTWAADTIRQAHALGLMKKADLWLAGGDDDFWKRMTHSASPEICALAAKVHKGVEVKQTTPEEYVEGKDLKWTDKIRTLDPDVLVDAASGETRRLTELSAEYAEHRRSYLARKEGEKCWRITRA